MKFAVILPSLLMMGSLTLFAAEATEESYTVSAVGFTGLVNIGRDEIMAGTMSPRGSRVEVYPNRLKTRIQNHPLVKDYALKRDKDRLIVNITERVPVMRVVLEEAASSTVFEVDTDYRIVSRQFLTTAGIPTVFLYGKRNITEYGTELKRIFLLIMSIHKEYRKLYRELSRVEIHPDGMAAVTLKNRATVFRLRPVPRAFARLSAVAGYLDRDKMKPGYADLDDTVTVIHD